MKHLKKFENIEKIENDLKKLLKYFTQIFNDLGFNNENYINNVNKFEADFYMKGYFIFEIIMYIQNYTIIMTITKALNYSSYHDIVDYFAKKINAPNMIIKKDFYDHYLFEFDDVDKVIERISLEDLKIAKKYNL